MPQQPAFPQKLAVFYRTFKERVMTIVTAAMMHIRILIVVVNNCQIIPFCFIFWFYHIIHLLFYHQVIG